jgi:hypothetical protein
MTRNTAVVLLAAAVALTPLTADAQFTIKAGASFASTTESDLVPDVSNQTGFAIGLGYGFPLGTGAFSLLLEALYVQKGGDLGAGGSLKIDELDVPILLQWKIPIAVLSPFLYAGPQAELFDALGSFCTQRFGERRVPGNIDKDNRAAKRGRGGGLSVVSGTGEPLQKRRRHEAIEAFHRNCVAAPILPPIRQRDTEEVALCPVGAAVEIDVGTRRRVHDAAAPVLVGDELVRHVQRHSRPKGPAHAEHEVVALRLG